MNLQCYKTATFCELYIILFIIPVLICITLNIYLAKIYPRGYAGSMLEHSNLFHQISCLDKHPDDYKNILMDFIKFLIVSTT